MEARTKCDVPGMRDGSSSGGSLGHFIRNVVGEQLDLSEILDRYVEERGYSPYHPVMMVAVLLYANAVGIYASRRIARACQERLDFMALTGMQKPDFRTSACFGCGIWKH